MSRSFQAALFDMDGTLIDTEDQYTVFWGAIGREFLPEIPDFAYRIKGTTLKQMFERYFPDEAQQALIIPRLNAFEADMHYAFYPGAEAFVRDLRNHGVRTAIVTSSNDDKMQSVYRQMPVLHELFDRILTAEDFQASKPDPDCYLKGACVFGLQQQDCVVFEDAFTGLAAGMASGSYTIGLATGNSPEAIRDCCHTVWTGWEDKDYQSVIQLLQ